MGRGLYQNLLESAIAEAQSRRADIRLTRAGRWSGGLLRCPKTDFLGVARNGFELFKLSKGLFGSENSVFPE